MMNDFDERARRAARGARRAVEHADLPVDDGERKVKRRIVRRAAVVSSATAIALVAGLFAVVRLPGDDSPDVALRNGTGAFALAGSLKPFDQCDSALAYFKDHAEAYYLQQYNPKYYATDGGAAEGGAPVTTTIPSQQDTAKADGIAPNAQGLPGASTDTESSVDKAPQAPAHSTTNVQEKNVDEPDIVKTDGSRIVAVAKGQVRLLLANGGHPVLRSTLPAMNVQNVFMTGNRLVVFSASNQYQTLQYPPVQAVGSSSTVSMYDISDLAAAKLLSSLEITGSIVDARMTGTRVQVVTSYTPDIDVLPQVDQNGQLTEKSKQDLRNAIAASKIDQWTPSYTLKQATGATVASGQLVACNDLGHPQAFSGIGTTSLIAFDAAGSIEDRHSAGVVAGGQTVYADADTTYVTSTVWSNDAPANSTDIHAFSNVANGGVEYAGSGSVAGTLLNQYSMSEYDGALRVATTTNDQHGWISRRSVVQGQVAVLKLSNGLLEQVGLVTGLGAADNESIQSVRFVGDRGYVTTFRQTDPFYVLDLHDAANPRVAGELKVPGVSNYLHPVGDHLILSVGQSAAGNPEGTFQTTTVPPSTLSGPSADKPESSAPFAPGWGGGVSFDLYDVSDASHPKKTGSVPFGPGQAGASNSAKAFLYYEPLNLIVSPLVTYAPNGGMWQGLVMLRATDAGLAEVGRLQDIDQYNYNVSRTFIIEDNVYQLSDTALQVNSLTTHKDIARVRF